MESHFSQIRKNVKWAVHKELGYIGLMFVEEAYRGQGIAGLMIQDLVNWANKKNVEHIIIQVYEENVNAVNAYRKSGFKDFLMVMKYSPD